MIHKVWTMFKFHILTDFSYSLRIDTEDLSDVTSVSSIDTWTTTGSMISGPYDFPLFKFVILSNCTIFRFGTAPAAEPCQRPDHPEGVPRGQRGGGVPLRLLRQILHQPPSPFVAHGTDIHRLIMLKLFLLNQNFEDTNKMFDFKILPR